MADHTVELQIQECGQHNPPLGSSVGCLELRSIIPVLPGNHPLVLSEIHQYTPHFWACPVILQVINDMAGI